jgi:hypothetical protein
MTEPHEQMVLRSDEYLEAATQEVAAAVASRIQALKASINLSELPPATQIRVHQLDAHIRHLVRDINRRLDDFNEDFEETERLIREGPRTQG